MLDNVLKRINNCPDLVIKNLNINNNDVTLLFFETLTDTSNINDFLLKYLSYINDKNINYKLIPNFSLNEIYTIDEIVTNIFNGFVVIFINNKYYALEFRRVLDSGITKSDNEKTIRGPKDSFSENYQTNVGLIRKRIRNESLKLREYYIGVRSNTKIGIMYVDDIVNKNMLNKIINNINKINIDSILDSTYIYEYIKNNKSLFPNALITERPDLVSYKLLNGKVCIIVDNSPYVILFPAFFMEFFHTMDDYYENNIIASYIRIIRLIAFMTTVILPGLYIALITYNYEIVPTTLLTNFAIQKENVPFPTIIEAILMNTIFEILHETDLRAPSTLGSALSIVGALVLGDAAVKAGLVSPIMVIVIAITAISELIFSINDVSNASKIWRLLFIILASTSGIIGVFIGIFLLISELTSINSFGYPYMYPSSPFDKLDEENNIVLTKKYKFSFRNKLTAKKNIKRGAL